jgi:type IX secretion system PorP/SprF family membrane protein
MKRLLLWILMLISSQAMSQNNFKPNLFDQDIHYYNPAHISLDTGQRARILLQGQYKVIANESEVWHKNPNVYAAYTGKLKSASSFVSASVLYDQYSFFTRNVISAGYTHVFQWHDRHRLSLGAMGKVNVDFINLDQFITYRDDNFGKSLKVLPDLDAGMLYQSNRVLLGISVRNVFGFSSELDQLQLTMNQRALHVNGSYLFTLGKNVSLKPFFMYSREKRTTADVGARLHLYHKVGLGYYLSVLQLRGIYSMDIQVSPKINLGISYDKSAIYTDHHADFALRYKL